MREVVDYLEFDKSGVCGFNQRKPGWSETVEKINIGALLKSADSAICEAVISWQQEERSHVDVHERQQQANHKAVARMRKKRLKG